jgi:hypothetical protein
VQNAGSCGNLAERSSILSVIVPTDGTSAATEGKGDFGTSPILGSIGQAAARPYFFI